MFSEFLTSMLLVGMIGGPVGLGLGALLLKLLGGKRDEFVPPSRESWRVQ